MLNSNLLLTCARLILYVLAVMCAILAAVMVAFAVWQHGGNRTLFIHDIDFIFEFGVVQWLVGGAIMAVVAIGLFWLVRSTARRSRPDDAS